MLLADARDYAAAIATLEQGLRYTSNDPGLASKLAWMLATCPVDELRDGRRAAKLAESAVIATGGAAATVVEALAAAQAECGEYESAMDTLLDALAPGGIDLSDRARARITQQLTDYRNQRPHRAP